MSTAGISAAARVIKQRLKNRKLPTMEVPSVESGELARTLQSVQEHFRMYEGDSGAPKERFVTIAELEEAGLLKADVKTGFAYISQVVGKDVAQKAGSTSNPTLKDPVKKDTSRTGRIPTGGGGGSATPSKQAATSTASKLGAASDVSISKAAQGSFLYQDGGKWIAFPLFNTANKWRQIQNFDGGITVAGSNLNVANWDTAYGWGDHASGGYLTTLNGTGDFYMSAALGDRISLYDNRLDATNMYGFGVESGATYSKAATYHRWYLGVNADGGTSDTMELAAAGLTVNGTVTATGGNSTNWNTAYGWGDHAGTYLPLTGGSLTGDITLTTGADRKVRIGSSTSYYYDLKSTGDDFNILEAGDVAKSVLHYDYSTKVLTLGYTGTTVNSVGVLTATGGLVAGGADTKPAATYSALTANMLHLDGKEAIDGADTYLRLNQNGDFSTGVYTPGAVWCGNQLRVDSDMDVNGNIVCDGATIISGVETINIDSTGDITKTSHGNYLYHASTAYDNDQNGQITFGTGAASGGTTGDIHFQYT